MYIAGESNSNWGTVDLFEYEVLNSDNNMDEACIRACRALVSNYIQLHAKSLMNGITLEDSILPCYDVK